MSLTDPIGNLLTSVRNASRAGKALVEVPASRLAARVMECLKQEGFIQNWRLIQEGTPQGVLRIYLRYTQARRPILRQIQRVSKPGLRKYVGKAKMPNVLAGIGTAILTTPNGVMTASQAKQQGVGGEVICYVW